MCSFFDFNFIKRDWLFLKTAVGRGAFDIFVSMSFMAGGEDLFAWILAGAFFVCGLGFIIAGCICGKDADMKDLSKADTAKAAGDKAAKGAVKGAQMAADSENQ